MCLSSASILGLTRCTARPWGLLGFFVYTHQTRTCIHTTANQVNVANLTMMLFIQIPRLNETLFWI